MMSNDVFVDNDIGNADNDSEDNDENEVLCSACGFSSECVPEGMISCPSNCSIVCYCSVECRDWAWTGGHKNLCPVANEAATGKSAASILPTNDAALKSHNTSLTSIRNDSGKLGESFSDGSVSVASSIEVNNLFDKKPSPFFSKNKFGQFAQSSSKSSVASSPKQLPLATKSVANESPSSGAQSSSSNVAKRGPKVSKTLGNHFNGNAPTPSTNKQLFVVSTDYDEDSDDGDNDKSAEENVKDDKGSMSDFDYMEDQSVGMSVLEVESVANLTAIVEESSNLMSVPVIEASWRRNLPDLNPNPDRLNELIGRPHQSQLDMDDSEIIGCDSLADLMTMQHTDMLLQQQDDLVYGVRSHSNSESISSMMGNQNSVVIHSMGSVYNETSDEEDFSYSQASAGTNQDDGEEQDVAQQPEIVESSNSSDSADPDYITNSSGVLGGRPAMSIQRGPSLRGFRDAYNECDTESLHSRSIAQSSSSEDSMSSHCDAAADLPERLQRSSSSLKDFREIYNSDLKRNLLREPSTDSLGCSSSFDYTSDKIVSPIKTNNDGKLSHQLELICIKSERSLQQTEEIRSQHSQSRSEDTSSLQMARMRNESMKHSLNSALRVYEEMYGEDAAKDVFYQLTSTAESNLHHQNVSKSEQTFEWKRSEPAKQDVPPAQANTASDATSKSVPKYMQYRTSLSSTNLHDDVASSMKPDRTSQRVAPNVVNLIQTDTASSLSSTSVPKYLQYRTALSSAKITDDIAESTISDLASENVASADTDPISAATATHTSSKSVPKYLQYRTSLSSTECINGESVKTKTTLPKEEPEIKDVPTVDSNSTNILASKSVPKYMQYRTTLSSTELKSGNVSGMKQETPRDKAESNAVQSVQIDTANNIVAQLVPEYLQDQRVLSIRHNDGNAHATSPDLKNEKAESANGNTQMQSSEPTVLPGTARYIQYRDNLLKERSTSSTGVDALPVHTAGVDSTMTSDDPISVHETKSNSNLSCTVNSSSDVGYLPLESLYTQMITEEGAHETSSTPAKPQVQNQFSQRYLQYRKSMIKPMISGTVNSIPKNNDKKPSTKSSTQSSQKTSNISNVRSSIKSEPTKNQENVAIAAALSADSSKSVTDIHPRYLNYRLSLASIDIRDSNMDVPKKQDTTQEKYQSAHAYSKGHDQINDSTALNESSTIEHIVDPSNGISTNSSREIHFEYGEIIEKETSNEKTKSATSANAADMNPDLFRFTFNQKYKQYRSSLQSLLDSENKEYVERLEGEAMIPPLNIQPSSTADSNFQQGNGHGISGEVANTWESVGEKGFKEYQLIDLDESTVSSEVPNEYHPIGCKQDEIKSSYGLDVLGYCGVSCSGATIDSEAFLKVWNEMETDQNSLCEQRDAYESNAKAVPKADTIQKKSKAKEMPLLYTTNEMAHQSQENILDITMDIETGLLSPNFDEQFTEEDMKERAKDFRKKQRFGWCIIVFVAIALPLGIGLGVALGRKNTNVLAASSVVAPLTAVPTKSPSLAPMETVQKPASLSSPMLPTPTLTPLDALERTLPPTSSPTTNPVATASPQTILTPTTRSPIIQSSLSPIPLIPKNKEELLQIIGRVSSDNGTAIQSIGSPQSLAFEWLVSDQTTNSSVYSDERIIQRYALATLYYSTDGSNWLDNAGWLSKENECTWHTLVSIENCDSEGMYTSVDLSANDLTGVVPNEVALLSRLATLKLSGGPSRFVGGIIPSALGTLTGLKVLDFQENIFFGSIPSELGSLGMLEMLDLSMNRLSLSIPTHIGRLTLLKRLNLAGNNLTGEIPSTLNELTQLERLSFGNNDLSGQIRLGTGLTLLTELNLEQNGFSSIGTEIGLLQGLEEMTIYDNTLIGALPTQLTRLSALIRLDLHGNKLTGAIPIDIGNLSRLTNLDLSSNQFSNEIPSSIGSLTNLLKLNLQKNLLEGPIPSELGKLSSTFVIRINENNISGSVPDNVCESFGLNPLFYLDCKPRSDGTAEITCPPGTCCSFCCSDGGGCECGYIGTSFEFLCDVQ